MDDNEHLAESWRRTQVTLDLIRWDQELAPPTVYPRLSEQLVRDCVDRAN